MNPQEKLLEYGKQIKNNNNTGMNAWTPEEILGKAISEGIVITRDAGTTVSANVKRIGKTITVTETTKTPTLDGYDISTVTVMTIDL